MVSGASPRRIDDGPHAVEQPELDDDSPRRPADRQTLKTLRELSSTLRAVRRARPQARDLHLQLVLSRIGSGAKSARRRVSDGDCRPVIRRYPLTTWAV